MRKNNRFSSLEQPRVAQKQPIQDLLAAPIQEFSPVSVGKEVKTFFDVDY